RGAKKAVFVDLSSDSLKIVRQNIELTHLEDKSECLLRDYITYLNETTEKFDYIFLDPPYAADFLEPALSIIHKNKLLNEDGIVVCELDSSDSYSALDGFEIYRDKKYGKARILLMKEL
ncbi:MAG: RsmD family RNA methyltransferase, partial [Clostridia bacterium]|nr:RsmD family RNA methyltransferase [Clostridia bacterium]